MFLFLIESQPSNIVKRSTNENIVKVKYTDIYADETCQRSGQCSYEEHGYQIPDQCKI